MKITTKINAIADARAQFQRIGALPARALAATAEQVEVDFLEPFAARHHGKAHSFGRSITKVRLADGWLVGNDSQVAPAAIFVHWGTRPHKILPKRKTVLRWPSAGAGGGFVFARGVNHPGYKGDPWAVRAAAEAPRIFAQHLAAMTAAKG